jgi:hypothetical protein
MRRDYFFIDPLLLLSLLEVLEPLLSLFSDPLRLEDGPVSLPFDDSLLCSIIV